MKTVDKMLRANPAIAPDCLWFNNQSREIYIIESSVQCNPREKEKKNREANRVQYVKTTKNKYKQKEIHEKVKIQSNNNNNKIYENNQSMINRKQKIYNSSRTLL